MATYKVIQDIEAEDKLLGPLTLRQFTYAGIALTCAYLQFLLITKGLAFMMLFLAPPMLVFGFLAWPFGRDQPTEIWVIAKLRFMFKPRKRIWDQTGMKELVTITAPVKEEKVYTDGLSQVEVKSRLQALASTIDSRGWAVKNVNVNLFAEPHYGAQSSDRLIDPGSLPQEVEANEIAMADDILDEQNNPTARNLTQMISNTSAAYRQQLMDRIRKPAPESPAAAGPQPDYWFLNQPSTPPPAGQAMFAVPAAIQPDPATQAMQADQPMTHSPAAYTNMHTVQPLNDQQPAILPAPVMPDPVSPSPKTPDPAILELANNDDLNVATIARQAQQKKAQANGDGEVVISLH